MKVTRKQLKTIIVEALGDRGDLPKKHQYRIGMRGPEDLPYGNVTGRTVTLPALDPQVKAAADYLEEGIRSSIEFADHPIEADPNYQINRTLEAMQYETNFTDNMFPGVNLEEVKIELMRRFDATE